MPISPNTSSLFPAFTPSHQDALIDQLENEIENEVDNPTSHPKVGVVLEAQVLYA